jgi:hypothetical protein
MIEIRDNKMKIFNLMNKEIPSSLRISIRKTPQIEPPIPDKLNNLYITSPIKFFHPEINYYQDNIRLNSVLNKSSRNKIWNKSSFQTSSSSRTLTKTTKETNIGNEMKIKLFKTVIKSKPSLKIEELKFDKQLSNPVIVPAVNKTLYKFKFKISQTPLYKVPNNCIIKPRLLIAKKSSN